MVQVQHLEWEAWKKMEPMTRAAVIHATVQKYYDCQQEEEAILDRFNKDTGPGEMRAIRRSTAIAVQNLSQAARYLDDRDPATFKFYKDHGVYEQVEQLMRHVRVDPNPENRKVGIDTLVTQGELFKHHGDPSHLERTAALMTTVMVEGIKPDNSKKLMLGENVNWDDPLMAGGKADADFRKHLVSQTIPQLVISHPKYADRFTAVLETAAAGDFNYDVRAAALDTLAAISVERDDDYGVRVRGAFERARRDDPNERVRAAAESALETVAFVAQSRAAKPGT